MNLIYSGQVTRLMTLNGTLGYQDETGTHTVTFDNSVYKWSYDKETDELYIDEEGRLLHPDTPEYKMVRVIWDNE